MKVLKRIAKALFIPVLLIIGFLCVIVDFLMWFPVYIATGANFLEKYSLTDEFLIIIDL